MILSLDCRIVSRRRHAVLYVLCFSPAKVFVFLPSEGGVGSQDVLSLYNPSKDQSVAYKVTYVTPRHNHLCSSSAMRRRVVNSVRPLLSYRVCVLHKRCAKLVLEVIIIIICSGRKYYHFFYQIVNVSRKYCFVSKSTTLDYLKETLFRLADGNYWQTKPLCLLFPKGRGNLFR